MERFYLQIKRPKDSEIYYVRANIYSTIQKHKEALNDLNKAIELNPKKAFYYSKRGIEKSNLWDFKGALRDIDTAIELEPNEYHFYLVRSLVNQKQKKYKEAIVDMDKAIKLNQVDPFLYCFWTSFWGFLLIILWAFVIAHDLIDLLLDWLLDYVQSKNETPEERKTRLMIKAWRNGALYKSESTGTQQENAKRIKNLAEKYINEVITEDKTELTQEDYKNFYELVQENNVEIEYDYPASVPYIVRSSLYDSYIKRTGKTF